MLQVTSGQAASNDNGNSRANLVITCISGVSQVQGVEASTPPLTAGPDALSALVIYWQKYIIDILHTALLGLATRHA